MSAGARNMFCHLAHRHRDEHFRIRVAREAGVGFLVVEIGEDAGGGADGEFGEGVETLGEGADPGYFGEAWGCWGGGGFLDLLGGFGEEGEEEEGEEGVGVVVYLHQPVFRIVVSFV